MTNPQNNESLSIVNDVCQEEPRLWALPFEAYVLSPCVSAGPAECLPPCVLSCFESQPRWSNWKLPARILQKSITEQDSTSLFSICKYVGIYVVKRLRCQTSLSISHLPLWVLQQCLMLRILNPINTAKLFHPHLPPTVLHIVIFDIIFKNHSEHSVIAVMYMYW